MGNFEYLNNLTKFDNLKTFCNDAEEFALSRPELSVHSARKALEFVVKLVYKLKLNYEAKNATLIELVDNMLFKGFVNNSEVVDSLHFIRMVGNKGSHGESIKKKKAVLALKNLHFFVGEVFKKLELIESYSEFNEELLIKTTNEKQIVKEAVKVEKAVTEQVKVKNVKELVLNLSTPQYMTEAETRRLYIDEYLLEAGWQVLETVNTALAGKAGIEIEVDGMPSSSGKGYVDYVLYDRAGKPIALVEAKKTSVSVEAGRHQATLYADCLEKQYGTRPVVYYSNGYVTRIIDGLGYPDREVLGFHRLEELELLLQRRDRSKIVDLKIDNNITDRHYQKTAITNVCESFNNNRRKALIVMATGTGKTRTAISLVDVLMRNSWIKNVLFLADRTALVKQAKKNFAKLLPNATTTILSESKPDMNARVMFSTYQTMINYIDSDVKEFGIGRFDLVIIDEAHRSVFNKYKAIFSYFDSLLVGLTATPRSEVDKSTYQLFDLEEGEPNYHYELNEAVEDEYLVGYVAYDKTTKLLDQGIVYNQLSEQEKAEYENTFIEDGYLPEEITSDKIFNKVHNKNTVDKVLHGLMSEGLKVNSGEKIGKTIIFAYNHKHAQLIVDRFKDLYSKYDSEFCALIDNYVNYAQNLIEKFEVRDGMPQVAVSVDMLDTGIDVPDILNLVFFKPVKSKIKFNQMIGRGTRLSQNIFGPGKHKEKFLIFDYCGNFSFFELNPDGNISTPSKSLTQKIFEIKVDLVAELQKPEYQLNKEYKEFYENLKQELIGKVSELNKNRIEVRENILFVDKYKQQENWFNLSVLNVKEIKFNLAKLIDVDVNEEETAKLFDLKVFYAEVNLLDNGTINSNIAENIIKIAKALKEKISIPQVRVKLDVINKIQEQVFWNNVSVFSLEEIRQELRDLIKFLKEGVSVYVTDFKDEEVTNRRIVELSEFKTYREKILDYLLKNYENRVINKIKNLEPIDNNDMEELERILWQELGTKEEYYKVVHKDNLAVFIRSIVGIEQEAINQKFSKFLDNNTFTSKQQELIKAIINYVRQNGDITVEEALEVSPFKDYDLQTIFGDKINALLESIQILHKAVAV